MSVTIRRVTYFYTTIRDRPGEAYHLLSELAASKVNLLAFNAVPTGPDRAQLTLFPDSVEQLAVAAEKSGVVLEGPHPAILVQGDDRLGALADLHQKLSNASINVFSATAVTDGKGCYGRSRPRISNGRCRRSRASRARARCPGAPPPPCLPRPRPWRRTPPDRPRSRRRCDSASAPSAWP